MFVYEEEPSLVLGVVFYLTMSGNSKKQHGFLPGQCFFGGSHQSLNVTAVKTTDASLVNSIRHKTLTYPLAVMRER